MTDIAAIRERIASLRSRARQAPSFEDRIEEEARRRLECGLAGVALLMTLAHASDGVEDFPHSLEVGDAFGWGAGFWAFRHGGSWRLSGPVGAMREAAFAGDVRDVDPAALAGIALVGMGLPTGNVALVAFREFLPWEGGETLTDTVCRAARHLPPHALAAAAGHGTRLPAALGIGADLARMEAFVGGLINAGVDLDASPAGGIPHALARTCGDAVAFEALLAHGADRESTYRGLTPLLYAAYMGRADLLRSMAGLGCSPVAVSKDGRTVLHMLAEACWAGRLREPRAAVAWLVTQGVDVEVRYRGRTAADLFREVGERAWHAREPVRLWKRSEAQDCLDAADWLEAADWPKAARRAATG